MTFNRQKSHQMQTSRRVKSNDPGGFRTRDLRIKSPTAVSTDEVAYRGNRTGDKGRKAPIKPEENGWNASVTAKSPTGKAPSLARTKPLSLAVGAGAARARTHAAGDVPCSDPLKGNGRRELSDAATVSAREHTRSEGPRRALVASQPSVDQWPDGLARYAAAVLS